MFRDITPLLASPAGLEAAIAALVDVARDLKPTSSSGPRRAASCSGRRWRATSARASCSRASRATCRTTRSAPTTRWSTAPTRSSCTSTPSARARACSCTTTCSPRGTARALCKLVEQLGGEVVGCAFLIELSFLGGRETLAPHDVHSLIDYDSRMSWPSAGAAAPRAISRASSASASGPAVRRGSTTSVPRRTTLPGFCGFSCSRASAAPRGRCGFGRQVGDDAEVAGAGDLGLREADEQRVRRARVEPDAVGGLPAPASSFLAISSSLYLRDGT